MQTLRAGTAQIEYASLLRRTLAAVIHSGREKEKEKDRCISIFEGLDQKRERLTSAERRLAELLTVRIEDFEPKAYALKPARPVEVLRELMDQTDSSRGICSKSSARPESSPRREIHAFTVEHIPKLSRRGHVSPEVFFESGFRRDPGKSPAASSAGKAVLYDTLWRSHN
jgi:antitoxin component HigA of HigAB toxin-antitoxin module